MSVTLAKLFVFCILMLLCLHPLVAQDTYIEHHGGGTDVILILPYKNFIFDKNREQTDYQVSIEIKDSKKKQVARHEETLHLNQMPELKDAAVMVKFSTLLPAGDYDLGVIIKNPKMGDKRTLNRSFDIRISSIEIGMAYLIGEKGKISFLLSSYQQMGLDFDRLYLYQNISVPLDSMRVVADDKAWVYHDLQFTNQINLKWLNKTPVPPSITLQYFESNIRYSSDPFMFGAWQNYGSTYNLKDQLAQIRYIATQNEWNTLRRLPPSKHQEAIERYWEKHDPSPGTQRNEAREEFYQRILSADERFTIHSRLKGWKSDRGRVFIKYGHPDDIVTEAYPNDAPPYIVWQYYSINKRFVFQDTKGYGQYTLTNKEDEYEDF